MSGESAVRNFLTTLLGYTQAAWKCSRSPDSDQSFASMMGLFPKWFRTLGSSPLAQQTPWMPYRAIAFLMRTARRDSRVFEWGVGGSTLFFSDRVEQLVSVEHDADWSQTTRDAMKRRPSFKWELLVVPPRLRAGVESSDPSDPSAYASALEPYRELSFDAYAGAIDRFDDRFFDIVLVDGRCRTSCAMHGMPKVKPGGYLLLDDSTRERYRWVAGEMQQRGWTATQLVGPGPCLRAFQQATAWRRPLDS